MGIPALTKADLHLAAVIAHWAVLGALTALLIAALFFPMPTNILGDHLMILDSQAPQFRFEPREKVFYGLTLVLSVLCGGLGAFTANRFRLGYRLMVALIVSDIIALNFLADRALNGPNGQCWAGGGLIVYSLTNLAVLYRK
jgi:hypothetical protein